MRKSTLALIFMMSVSLQLTSFSLPVKALSQTVYDFDDTLMATTSEISLYKTGVDPKVATPDQIQKVGSADWAEVRHQVGKDGPYKNWVIHRNHSFSKFAGTEKVNGFLELIKDTLAKRTPKEWQAPKWSDFVARMSRPESAQEVYLLTARSASRDQILEGFQYLKSQGWIHNVMPKQNIYAVSDSTLTLKSDPKRFLSKESTEVAKSLVMLEMLDDLEKQAVAAGDIVSWSFYDDDYANFKLAQDKLLPQASTRWPHVKITIGYVGSKHAGVEPHEITTLPKKSAPVPAPAVKKAVGG